ncbi:MAG: DUF4384 domain-containing protein [Deltaproteobacteria bacterium]|nr:DUF4384 domain-containing protein [Deltaproteobacteria bacterium]
MNATHPSELALERHLLDPAASAVKSHVESCQRCGTRLAEMKRQGEEFLQFVFPATVEKVEQAAEKGARRFSWIPLFAPVSAVAAAAALFLLVQPASDGFPADYDGIKGRGGLGLSVFVNRATGVHCASEGEPVSASEQIRFRVDLTRKPCHLWIVSVDASGQVSRLFPTTGDGGVLVATQYEIPGGAVLDGKPGPERVYAICTPQPTYYAALERAVQAATARGEPAVRSVREILGLPEGTAQASVLLEKR